MRLPSQRVPIHEALPTGLLLAVTGGFLDAYTYLSRGGVFANAQTGNIVLLCLSAAKGEWLRMLYYCIPILAFFLGVLATEAIKHHSTRTGFARWEHIVILIELLLLLVIGFLPASVPNVIVNVTVSFICSIQVNSFRKIHDISYASTMCTGNLRSAAENFFLFAVEKDRGAGKRFGRYALILLAFCLGAVLGALLTGWLGGRAVWFCCLVLATVLGGLLLRN